MFLISDLLPSEYDSSTNNLLVSGSLCSLVTSHDGLVYHRGNLRPELCRSREYAEHMAIMFGKLQLPGGGGAVVTCCSASGCNWNTSTATKNLPLDQFDSSSFLLAGLGSSGPWLVLILMFVTLSMLIIVLYLRSRQQEDDNNHTRPAINKTRFFGRVDERDRGEERNPWVGAGNGNTKSRNWSLRRLYSKTKHKLFGKKRKVTTDRVEHPRPWVGAGKVNEKPKVSSLHKVNSKTISKQRTKKKSSTFKFIKKYFKSHQ